MSIQSRIFKLNCTKSDCERDKNLKMPKSVTVYRDIPYDAKGNLLDITIPNKVLEYNKRVKLPVIVSVHGGGFVYGNKEVYQYYAADLARHGFVVVNFNYRLAPRSKFPAPLVDTNNVLKWLVKHAEEYYADIDKVFMVGDSAGAQITSQYAAIYSNKEYAKEFDFKTPGKINLRGVALNCGVFALDIKEKGLHQDYLGSKIKADDPRLDVLSAVTENYPASFVMTAEYDFLKDAAMPMYNLIKSKGVTAKYMLYGEEGQYYMCHVFHCNLNLKEAKVCNKDECDFFKSLI